MGMFVLIMAIGIMGTSVCLAVWLVIYFKKHHVTVKNMIALIILWTIGFGAFCFMGGIMIAIGFTELFPRLGYHVLVPIGAAMGGAIGGVITGIILKLLIRKRLLKIKEEKAWGPKD